MILRSGFGPFSYALFGMDGCQVPQQMVIEVGEAFKRILKEVGFLLLKNLADSVEWQLTKGYYLLFCLI